MTMTSGQRRALATLMQTHDRNPIHGNFATVHLGTSTAALLRQIADSGLVTVTRGGRGSRQFFAITEAGRAALQVTA